MKRVRIAILLGLFLTALPAKAEPQEQVWLPIVLNEVRHCRRCVTLPVEP